MTPQHFTLDTSTYLFCMSLFAFMMSAISYSSASTLSANIFGLREWAKALIFAGVSFLCFSFRGYGPEWATILLANLAMLAVPGFATIAYSRFFCVKTPLWITVVPLAAGAAVISWAFLSGASLSWVAAGVCVPVIFTLARMLTLIARHANWRRQPSALITIFAYATLTGALTLRMAKIFFFDSGSAALYAQSSTQVGFLLGSSAAIIAGSLGLLLMAHDKQKKDILDNSRRDGLTGLYTRSAFMESASVLDQPTAAEPYSVVMVDIDFFKKINDSYGHASGDVAIIHTARLIAKSIRGTDLAARYGGEEFCVLLRGCGPDDAQTFAARLVREAGAQTVRLPNGEDIQFTLSAGYAHRALGGDQAPLPPGVKQMLDIADKALYEAKNTGRNRAVGARPPF